VIYSGKGEGARLVEEVGAGLVVPPEDPVALAQAMVKLADDPERARAMGERGRRFVEEHLSWPALVKRWVKELEERTRNAT